VEKKKKEGEKKQKEGEKKQKEEEKKQKEEEKKQKEEEKKQKEEEKSESEKSESEKSEKSEKSESESESESEKSESEKSESESEENAMEDDKNKTDYDEEDDEDDEDDELNLGFEEEDEEGDADEDEDEVEDKESQDTGCFREEMQTKLEISPPNQKGIEELESRYPMQDGKKILMERAILSVRKSPPRPQKRDDVSKRILSSFLPEEDNDVRSYVSAPAGPRSQRDKIVSSRRTVTRPLQSLSNIDMDAEPAADKMRNTKNVEKQRPSPPATVEKKKGKESPHAMAEKTFVNEETENSAENATDSAGAEKNSLRESTRQSEIDNAPRVTNERKNQPPRAKDIPKYVPPPLTELDYNIEHHVLSSPSKRRVMVGRRIIDHDDTLGGAGDKSRLLLASPPKCSPRARVAPHRTLPPKTPLVQSIINYINDFDPDVEFDYITSESDSC
jgi:hypothetical protein